MTKVVINSDYGGFNLSDEAFEALLNRKGVQWEKTTSKFNMSIYYEKGHVNDEDYYIDFYRYYDNRSDPDLVAVVQELGSNADGWCSSLKVVEIPDGVEWFVGDYDGREWVAEKHRTWK